MSNRSRSFVLQQIAQHLSRYNSAGWAEEVGTTPTLPSQVRNHPRYDHKVELATSHDKSSCKFRSISDTKKAGFKKNAVLLTLGLCSKDHLQSIFVNLNFCTSFAASIGSSCVALVVSNSVARFYFRFLTSGCFSLFPSLSFSQVSRRRRRKKYPGSTLRLISACSSSFLSSSHHHLLFPAAAAAPPQRKP